MVMVFRIWGYIILSSLLPYLGEKRNKDKNKILVLIDGNVVTLTWISYEYITRILLLSYLVWKKIQYCINRWKIVVARGYLHEYLD